MRGCLFVFPIATTMLVACWLVPTASAYTERSFDSASHKVRCYYISTGGGSVSCTVVKSASTGLVVQMGKNRKPRKFSVGPEDGGIADRGPVLATGRKLQMGPFTCKAFAHGRITCQDGLSAWFFAAKPDGIRIARGN
jgi:hypothetical protein